VPELLLPVEFVKGHGTQNDFILIPDRADALDVSAEQVRRLCDRRGGIGADGVIRIAPTPDGSFFMDHRNADGSLAEMCGNGARVFAAYLYEVGWVEPGPFTFHTRGGERQADQTAGGLISISMGPARVCGIAAVRPRLVDGSRPELAGLAVDVGNPHLVTVTDVPLDQLDLTSSPDFDAEQFPNGANIEFVTVQSPGAVSMRVFERGVGETRSCGTGTVAVAAAHLALRAQHHGSVQVTVPGGVVQVDIDDDDCVLTGSAVLVASGRIDPFWWAGDVDLAASAEHSTAVN
jgi:diaminopimelate epimerase